MLKTFFKLLLSTIVYTIIYILANVGMPYSQGLKDLGSSDDPLGMVYLLIVSAFVCFTIYFIIRHSRLHGQKLFLNLVFVLFFVHLFMAQIETLYFGYAFPALTTLDVVLIMVAGLIPLLVTVPLMIKFFQNKDVTTERMEMNIQSLLIKLGVLGIIYTCNYMIFGYFVAWQFEELRIFYSGSSEKLNFWTHLSNNDLQLYFFQILRGILFGAFVIPLKNMIRTKMAFITSVCLVYLYLAIVLILPVAFFPDRVRLGHLLEMTSSMLLFGIIAGNILWENQRKKQIEIR